MEPLLARLTVERVIDRTAELSAPAASEGQRCKIDRHVTSLRKRMAGVRLVVCSLHSRRSCRVRLSCFIVVLFKLAERVGFEPTERFPAHSISSAANSTTLAPLQRNCRLSDCQIVRISTAAIDSTSDICNLQSAI